MQSTSGVYFSRLDHLRFLAALLVISWHATHAVGVPTTFVPDFWVFSLFEEGHTGVSLFMTLSGFIFFALTRDSTISYGGFLRNRILRIAPLFLLWVFYWYVTTPLDSLKTVLAIFALLNFPNTMDVGWTVIVEFQFYLLFPFLLVFAQRYGTRYLVGLVGLMVLIRTGAFLSNFEPTQPMAYWTIFGRMDQFLLGMLAYDLYRKNFRIMRSQFMLATILAAWVVVMHMFNVVGGLSETNSHPIWLVWPTVEGLVYGALIVSYLSAEVRLPDAIDKVVSWLGMLSFSLYMNHGMANAIAANFPLKLFRHVIDASTFTGALAFTLLACLPIAIAMSAVTYYLIERPFLDLRSPYKRPQKEAIDPLQ